MQNFKLTDGDLTLGPGNRMVLINGQSKLIQDLKLWLLEPLGCGFLTPNFGSVLSSFIGGVNPEILATEVEDEINRILSLYQTWQIERLSEAKANGTLLNFSRNELLNSINDIQTEIVGSTIKIKVSISTVSSFEDIILPITIGLDGITVE